MPNEPSTCPPDGKFVATLTVAELRAVVRDEMARTGSNSEDLVPLADVIPGRHAQDSAIAAGLTVVLGPRRKRMVRRSEWIRWCESRPVQPRPVRSAPADPPATLDDWDRAVLGGRR